ncbi:MAG: hypothetical protein KGM96_10960 [Acidobacteriota bacterium]|nr:hypothetical protein [Acidobacteriota bacterium]
MKRWLQRLVLILVACFVAVYLGDWAVFRLRGSPVSKITVNRYLTVPLKGNKQEFDYLGSVEVPCALSLFPHGALSPCWQVRRDANQSIKL